jgi:type IV secretory pathway VirB4 component
MCWEEIARDRTQPVFLQCEEAHTFLDPEIREPAMYLRNMSKRVRKYEGMLGVVFQSVVDASYEKIRLYGQAILDNSTYKLLFATDGKNLQETADTFQLTEAEQSILLGAPRGRALCLIGHQHVCVDFDIPQYKLDLMGKGGGR